MFYRKILTLLAILVLLMAGAQWLLTGSVPVALSAAEDPLGKVEAQVLTEIQAVGSTDVVIQFAGQADLSGATGMDWQARGEWVYRTLREIADRDQARAIAELDRRGTNYYSSFGGNRLFVWGVDLELLTWLSALTEVTSVHAPRTSMINQIDQEDMTTYPTSGLEILARQAEFTVLSDDQPQEITWGVVDTKADQFWSTFGFQGEGIVVAGIDTGVQYDHPALDQAYKCQDDPGNSACWWDPGNQCGGVPCDDNGHGTATMGPIVADDDPSLLYQVGMAPGGQWIACKGCDGNGMCTDYALTACAEWVMAPGGDPANRPHVVSNAWGGACEDGDWYLPYISAWMAAGITASFSPGGSGPGCGTMGSPAAYQQVFAPTAHDENRLIASFASRGPGCKGNFLKPNISAPGVNLWLPVPTDNWQNYNGTSFSNSYGAGAMVLLLSCSPDLIGLPYDIMDALQEAADTPPEGNCGAPPDGEGNYTYGSGYVNMLEAGAQNCDEMIGRLEGYVVESWTEIPLAGATVIISPTLITVTNETGYYSATLPTGVYTITATMDGYEAQTITDVEVGFWPPAVQDFHLLRIGEWTQGPTDPSLINRSDCVWFDDGSGLVEYNRKAYCMGGRTSSNTETPNIWMFDPLSGTFSDTGDDMIEDVSNYTANLIQDEEGLAIYVVGGYSADTGSYVNYVQRYDPSNGQVSIISTDPWPVKVGWSVANPGGCAVAQNKIYCFGGFETNTAPYFSEETWEYDPYRPAGTRWLQITTALLSVPRGYIDVAMQDDIIYAMGGIYQYTVDDLIPTNVMEALDVNNLAAGWQPLASLPVATAEGRGFGFSSDTLDGLQGDWAGKVFVVGGGDWPDYSAEAMEYDVASNTWNQAFPDLIQARKNNAGLYIPLCTADPYDGLPGMWTIGGYMGSCSPPFAQPEYYPFTCTPQAEIELVKTVGTEANMCAETSEITVPTGMQVTYCFELVNTGEITMTVHDLVDDQLGDILVGFEYDLPAWGSIYVTHTVKVNESITNTATWTASDGVSITLQASDSAVVNILQPSIVLTKTVGIDPETCAESDTLEVLAGSEVTYCYEVLNDGEVTLTVHDLVDSQLGTLLDTYLFDHAPGERTSYLTTTVVVTDVTNTATWTAYTDEGISVSAMDMATVIVHEEPGLILTKTVGLNPNACAESDTLEVTPGTQVTYCYAVENQGDVPLVIHDLVDSQFGELLAGYALELLPGESNYITRTALITESVVNTATWTAYTEWGTMTQAEDTASVTVYEIEMYETFLPIVFKND